MTAGLLSARVRLFLLFAFLSSLIALFPLRIALDMLKLQETGLSAHAVHGGLWWGNIEQLSISGVPLGDVEAWLSPLALFAGRVRLDFVRQGTPGDLKGAISVDHDSFGIDDVTASIATGDIFAPFPVTNIELQDVSVRFSDGACIRAQGRVTTLIAAGTALPPSLSGDAVCDGAALLMVLASQSGMEKLNLRLEGDRNYTAQLLVRSSDSTQAANLAATGFAQVPGGYLLKLTGRL